jgi:quercetin dioxygenase-like cupin family protein
VLAVVAALLPGTGTAASPGVTLRPADRAWEAFGLAERVPVRGDLGDPDCPSVTLLRLRPDTRLPPHSAPVDRTYLLLSGTVHLGIGKKWDEARMHALPAGSFWVVPANTPTFEWSEDEAVCQVVATRPARDCPRPAEARVYTPDQIAWKPSGSAERAVLAGDPGKPGCPYVERFRLRADALTALPPDPSPGEVLWTVLSGTLRRATGAPEKPGLPAELPEGTVIVGPASTDVAGSGATGTVAQRQFVGTRRLACDWREPHR